MKTRFIECWRIQAKCDRGAATAEYVVATMAAVAFATLLLAIFKSDEVRALLLSLVRQALTVTGS